ncbi:MAG: hypothetical protein WBB45_02295 [Cyclobacteriaceae bacterium]
MRCRKILIGFDGTGSIGPEIDFVSRYLVADQALVVGAVLRKYTTVKLPCKCKCNGQLTCAGRRKAGSVLENMAHRLEVAGEEKGFRTLVRKDLGMNITDLVQETRFADLLVLSQRTWRKISRGIDRLDQATVPAWECPLLILPDTTENFEQVILTYNGSSDAMQGIKQFSYMLPELTGSLPVTILATYHPAAAPASSEEKLFIEYLKEHFGEVAFHKVDQHSEHTLLSAVGLNEKCLVIINDRSPKELTLLNSLLTPHSNTMIPVELYTGRPALTINR